MPFPWFVWKGAFPLTATAKTTILRLVQWRRRRCDHQEDRTEWPYHANPNENWCNHSYIHNINFISNTQTYYFMLSLCSVSASLPLVQSSFNVQGAIVLINAFIISTEHITIISGFVHSQCAFSTWSICWFSTHFRIKPSMVRFIARAHFEFNSRPIAFALLTVVESVKYLLRKSNENYRLKSSDILF